MVVDSVLCSCLTNFPLILVPYKFSTYSDNHRPSGSLIRYKVITCRVSQLKMVQSNSRDKNQVLISLKFHLLSLLNFSSFGSYFHVSPLPLHPFFHSSNFSSPNWPLFPAPKQENSKPIHSCCPSLCSFSYLCNKCSVSFHSPDIHHPYSHLPCLFLLVEMNTPIPLPQKRENTVTARKI